MDNKILGVNFDDFKSRNDFLYRILVEYVQAKSFKQSKLIAHLNVHCLNLAYTNKQYNQLLNKADVLFFDSIGLKLAANIFLRLKVSFACTPPEWMHDLFQLMPAGTRLYFIGDETEVIENYVSLFYQSFPRLNAVGYHDGFFLENPFVEKQLIADIQRACPDIVVVGMGMPIQELWIEGLMKKVHVPMFIPVGAYYQRMTGRQKRPSEFISKIGMEWLHRLFLNPKGLFKRYLIGNFLFIFRIIRYRITNSITSKFRRKK